MVVDIIRAYITRRIVKDFPIKIFLNDFDNYFFKNLFKIIITFAINWNKYK